MPIAYDKISQIGGFLLLVIALFLGFSISSYSPDDPAWNTYTSPGAYEIRNLGGRVGAKLADLSLQLFGTTVVLVVGIGLVEAWYLMRRQWRSGLAVAWRGLLLLIAASSALHLFFQNDPVFASYVAAGGISGHWFASLGLTYTNALSASLLSIAAMLIALFVGVHNGLLLRQVWKQVHETISSWGCLPSWIWGRLQTIRDLKLGRVSQYVQSRQRWLQQRVQVLKAAIIPVRDTLPEPEVSVLFNSLAPHWSDEPEIPLTVQMVDAASAITEPIWEDSTAWPDDENHESVSNPIIVMSTRPPISTQLPTPHHSPPVSQQVITSEELPGLDLLDIPKTPTQVQSADVLEERGRFLESRLRDFGVEGEVVQVLTGPVITMFEYAPAPGVKVSKIVSLQDDLALVMQAMSVRVVAPIPGKAVVGIEIPSPHRDTVALRAILDSNLLPPSASKLTLALGKDIMGTPVVTDLAFLPHLLIAGSTGSGKSVGLNCMICTLLFRANPAEVKLIMIDPKMLELSIYQGIPHLLVPVVTNPKQAALALRRVVEEMERRYQLLAAKGVRSIAQYNHILDEEAKGGAQHSADLCNSGVGEDLAADKLPYLVIIIDELSDLMMVSSREVEDSLTRIAQMARAAGIHLIVATQRPSVDVLTGVIKANFPARLSFQVTSKIDSRTILDGNGAEQLLGRGDMLFLAPGMSKPQRVQSAFVSEEEINRLVEAWKEIEQPHYDNFFLEPAAGMSDVDDDDYDEKYDEAVQLVVTMGQASISMVQRRLRVGYNRAARIIEIMERDGVIGPADGVKPREVLVRKTYDSDED